MQNGVSRNYLAPGSLTDKNTFMKAFAFNSDVVKHRRSDDKKTNLRFDNGKSRKKSKGKHTFEDMKKKLLKDINHAKQVKKKSGRSKKVHNPVPLYQNMMFQPQRLTKKMGGRKYSGAPGFQMSDFNFMVSDKLYNKQDKSMMALPSQG